MGCFVVRGPADVIPSEIHSPHLSLSWKVLPHSFFLSEWMTSAPSFSRAWIHRERQLARRVLHFTGKEMVWECCGIEGTSFASEMLPGGAPFKHGLFNLDPKYQIGRLQQGLAESTEETYATWNDICERLSAKSLTKPSDMPIVLSGLAKDFAHLVPVDEYVAGLWRSTLPHSLLWHTRSFKPKNLKYVAPSWSWLSTGCTVTLANRSNIMTKDSVARISKISKKPMYQDMYGPVKSGSLEVQGILRRIRILFNERNDEFSLSVLDHEGSDKSMRAIGPSWDKHWGDRCKLELDATSEVPILDCFVFFITFHQWSDHESCRDIASLLLQRCGKKGSKFTRIGTLLLHDLYSLKMRYRIHESLDEDTWGVMQRAIAYAQDSIIEEKKKRTQAKDSHQSETAADDATSDSTSDSPRQPRIGFDALYQFDDLLIPMDILERLTPEVITIV